MPNFEKLEGITLFTTRKSPTSRRLLAGLAVAGALAAVPVTVAAGPASADQRPEVTDVKHDRRECRHGDLFDNPWSDLWDDPRHGPRDHCDPWDRHDPFDNPFRPHRPHGLFGSS